MIVRTGHDGVARLAVARVLRGPGAVVRRAELRRARAHVQLLHRRRRPAQAELRAVVPPAGALHHDDSDPPDGRLRRRQRRRGTPHLPIFPIPFLHD